MNRKSEPIRKVKVLGCDSKPTEWEDSGNNRIYNTSRIYARHFERLVERQPKANVELYSKFLKRTQIEGISIVRRLNYMRALLALKHVMKGRPISELRKEHIELFLDEFRHTSQATIHLRFECLKKFLRFIGRERLAEGIKTCRKTEIKVKASDLLNREDIQKLVLAASSKRGQAFIMTLYESGARIGELLNLRIEDVAFDPYGALVSLDGKTGRRRIRLVESAQLLKDWVSEIKLTHSKTPYLWFGETDNEPSQYATTVKFLRKTVKSAGLQKRVYPHLFRHSRASELAQKLREPQLRAFMGWTGSSDMPQVYIHLSAQDMDKAILELYKTEDSGQKTEMDEMAKFFEMYKRMKAVG